MFREIIRPTSRDYTIRIPEKHIIKSNDLNRIISSIRSTLDPEVKNMNYDEMRFMAIKRKHL
jgi:hypothetical protein